MKLRENAKAVAMRRQALCVLMLAGAVTLPAVTPAQEQEQEQAQAPGYPTLRPGLWEFTRSTSDGSGSYRQTKFTRQRCADPVADLKRHYEQLARRDCTLTPLARHGDAYEGASVCTVLGRQMESRTLLTALGDGDYSLVTVASGDYGTMTEEVSAVRLGDCRK